MARLLPKPSQNAFVDRPIVLSLAKFSYCTTLKVQSRLQWTHLSNRPGMVAVFDRIRSSDFNGVTREDVVLKIIVQHEIKV